MAPLDGNSIFENEIFMSLHPVDGAAPGTHLRRRFRTLGTVL
jgi:hypothetical protein